MDSKKRKRLSGNLSGFVLKPETVEIRVQKANPYKWSELSSDVSEKRAAAYKHEFTLSNQKESVTTLHAHGDFLTRPVQTGANTFEMQKHNIATSSVDTGAESLDALVGSFGGRRVGATNAMRVLKGTHTQWQLEAAKSNPVPKAEYATTLAAEIGISEFGRGGSHALLNAMSGLYLMKRKNMTKAQFLDPKTGYVGAGKGGAARLRKLQDKTLDHALHIQRLRSVYNTYAVNKVGKPWSGRKNDDGFSVWLEHKAGRWLQRQK